MEVVVKYEFYVMVEDEFLFKKGLIVKVNESYKVYYVELLFFNIFM